MNILPKASLDANISCFFLNSCILRRHLNKGSTLLSSVKLSKLNFYSASDDIVMFSVIGMSKAQARAMI